MTSCASTKVVSEWKDPNVTAKKFKKDHGNWGCQAAGPQASL